MVVSIRRVVVGAVLVSCAGVAGVAGAAPLTGTQNIPGDYATLAAAITSLNTEGVGAGGVTLNLVAGNPQVAPAGGYAITTTTGTAANPITLVGNGNTITAFTPQVAGQTYDAIIKIVGADYVRVTGFTLLENAANANATPATNDMTEWGIAVLYATATNGSQFVTLDGNTIELKRSYANTFGIYASSAHTPTAPATNASGGTNGTHRGLVIRGNSISQVNQGIAAIGASNAAVYTNGLDIGGTTAAMGNTITAFGNAATPSTYAGLPTGGVVSGIVVRNTVNYTVSFNTLASAPTVTATALRAINVPTFGGSTPSGTITGTINDNVVSFPFAPTAGSAALINIEQTTGNATTTLDVSRNRFANCGPTAAWTGALTLISAFNLRHMTIADNVFSGLSIATSGNVTLIARRGALVGGSVETVSGNRIESGFAKTVAGGMVAAYTGTSTTSTTAQMAIRDNDFRGITLTGATSFRGIDSQDGTASSGLVRTLTNNRVGTVTTQGDVDLVYVRAGIAPVVSDNTLGPASGAVVTGILVGLVTDEGTREVSGNAISGLTGSASVTGISVVGTAAVSPVMIVANTISTLQAQTGSALGIDDASHSDSTIRANRVDDVVSAGGAGSGATGIRSDSQIGNVLIDGNRVTRVRHGGAQAAAGPLAYGIRFAGGYTRVINNLVGDVTAASASGADLVRGISAETGFAQQPYLVIHNTVRIAGTSTGTDFGSSAMYHAADEAGADELTLRSNVFVNASTPKGAGLAVAWRQSGAGLENYATSSDRNLLHAGSPSPTHLLYFDGTHAEQTLAGFKALVAPREARSYFESPTFVSTTATDPGFLRPDPTVPTQIESGGAPIPGSPATDVPLDYDGEARSATMPDLGADEFDGVLLDLDGPAITVPPLANTARTTDRVATATISDAHGLAGGALGPRIYFRKNAGAYASTGCTGDAPDYACTIAVAAIGGVAVGDVIGYFVVAQDASGNVASSAPAGFAAVDVNTITSPPTTPASYLIVGPIPANVTIGAGGTYATLTASDGFFAAVNDSGITQPVTATIIGDLVEPGTVALHEIARFGTPNDRLTIRADGVAERLVSGGAGSGLLRLDGADRVTFDGNARRLRLRATGDQPALVFRNGATGNLVDAVIVESGGYSPTIRFDGLGGTGGNHDNTIRSSEIRSRSDDGAQPETAIRSEADANGTGVNDDNAIIGCDIHDFFSRAIDIDRGDRWRVTDNSLYATVLPATFQYGIIYTGDSATIERNVVGGTAPLGGGDPLTLAFGIQAILLIDEQEDTVSTRIAANRVTRLRAGGGGSERDYGILVYGNAIVADNVIGGDTVDDRFEARKPVGIAVNGNGVVRDNRVRFIVQAPAAIGPHAVGVVASSNFGSIDVHDNVIADVASDRATSDANDAQVIGLDASGDVDVHGNTIRRIASTSATAGQPGLPNRVTGARYAAMGATSRFRANVVAGVTAASDGVGATADVVVLLDVASGSAGAVSNNMLSTTVGGDRDVTGILDGVDALGSIAYDHNSVSLAGTASGGNGSAAFRRAGTRVASLGDNVFANTRAGGSGAHVALAVDQAAGWTDGGSDRNLLHAATAGSTARWLGTPMTLAAFRAASGTDASSITGDPLFVAADDLHLTAASPANDRFAPPPGTTITTDLDGDARSTIVTDVGADERDSAPALALGAVSRVVGDTAATSVLGTVTDADDAVATVSVDVEGATTMTRNGITVSALTMTPAGQLSGTVVAACGATDASFTLRAIGARGAIGTQVLAVTAAANAPPVLAYGAASLVFGESRTVTPSSGPSDGSGVATTTIAGAGTFTGTLATNGAGGVTIGAAGPVGNHVVTVRATDACGAQTDAPLAIAVGTASAQLTITSVTPAPLVGRPIAIAWQVAANAPSTATPTGTVNVTDGTTFCSASAATGTCSLTIATHGPRTLTATYTGSGGFAGTSTDTEAITVGKAADLAITKTSSLDLLATGLIQYTIIASNPGPSIADDALVTDDLPAALTGATWTCTAANGATCVAGGTGDIAQSVDLPGGGSVVFTVTAQVPQPFNVPITNTATIAAPADVTDLVATNNASSVTDVAFAFKDGFENPVSALAVAKAAMLPGSGDAVVVPATSLASPPPAAAPRLAQRLDFGDAQAWLLVRTFGDAAQAQLVRTGGAAWLAAPWQTYDATRPLFVVWTLDRDGRFDARLRQ